MQKLKRITLDFYMFLQIAQTFECLQKPYHVQDSGHPNTEIPFASNNEDK